MQPLVTIKLILIWLCMTPPASSTSDWKKTQYFVFAFMVIFSFLFLLMAHVAYIVKFLSADLPGCLFAFLGVCGFWGVIYIMISAFIMRQDINDVFEHLTDIYEINSDADSVDFLSHANEKSEWMCGYVKFAIGYSANIVLNAILSIYLCWAHNNSFDVNQFYHPLIAIYPWDQTTYFGYFNEICISSVTGGFYLLMDGAILVLFIAMCMHHQAFHEIIKHRIDNWKLFERNRDCDEKFICNLIDFHVSVQDWFFETVEVYSPFVMVQLVYCTIEMAIIAYFLDLQIQNPNSSAIILLSYCFACMAPLFLYCYYGKLASESNEKFADCVYDSGWHELPTKLQKYVPVLIANMQRPIYYNGFGFVNLDLNTFITFVRKVGTAYMMFKKIALQ